MRRIRAAYFILIFFISLFFLEWISLSGSFSQSIDPYDSKVQPDTPNSSFFAEIQSRWIYNTSLYEARHGDIAKAESSLTSLLSVSNHTGAIWYKTLELIGDIKSLLGERADTTYQSLFFSQAVLYYEEASLLESNPRIIQKIALLRSLADDSGTMKSEEIHTQITIPEKSFTGSNKELSREEKKTLGETRESLIIYQKDRNEYMRSGSDSGEERAFSHLWEELRTKSGTSMEEDW